MQLPFTATQFFDVMRSYNQAVWPAQVFLTAGACAALILILARRSWSSAAVSATLALLWLWVGAAYHFAFFTRINPLAPAFGVLFLAGAAVFLWLGVIRRTLVFEPRLRRSTIAGASLIVYALVVYPIWSTFAGHPYPALPTFGLPCPTTIFTIGMLCMATGPRRWLALVAPILWSAIGVQAAFLLAVPADLGLGLAGLLALLLAFERGGRSTHNRAHLREA